MIYGERICKHCGKRFKANNYGNRKFPKRKYCSRICSNRANASNLSKMRKGKGNPMFGKNPWNYVDGERQHKYAHRKWREFAEKIRKIYNYTCQECGKPGKIVHHITPVKEGGSDEVGNLMVVCRKCHAKIHRNNYFRRTREVVQP